MDGYPKPMVKPLICTVLIAGKKKYYLELLFWCYNEQVKFFQIKFLYFHILTRLLGHWWSSSRIMSSNRHSLGLIPRQGTDSVTESLLKSKYADWMICYANLKQGAA